MLKLRALGRSIAMAEQRQDPGRDGMGYNHPRNQTRERAPVQRCERRPPKHSHRKDSSNVRHRLVSLERGTIQRVSDGLVHPPTRGFA